jgi:hypothetical protein
MRSCTTAIPVAYRAESKPARLFGFKASRYQDANSLTWKPPGHLIARPNSDPLPQQRLCRNEEFGREVASLVDDLRPVWIP